MIGGITHQVQERTRYFFKDGTINLSIFAFQDEIKVLMLLQSYRTSGPIETRGHSHERHQPNLHQMVLERGIEAIFASEDTFTFTDRSIHFSAQRRHIGYTLAQTAGKLMEFRITIQF